METNEAAVVRILAERGWRITFAESCTGGLAAGRLVDVPDASKVFEGSFVTYANEKKIGWLGVEPALIERYGVVSEPVALAMAEGAAKAACAEAAVGISGVAGPSGGSAEKPVGMVCFGFCLGDRRESRTVQFGNLERNQVRKSAVDYVFRTLLELLGQV